MKCGRDSSQIHYECTDKNSYLGSGCPAQAHVTKIVIDQATTLADGKNESLTGRAFGELDPKDPCERNHHRTRGKR